MKPNRIFKIGVFLVAVCVVGYVFLNTQLLSQVTPGSPSTPDAAPAAPGAAVEAPPVTTTMPVPDTNAAPTNSPAPVSTPWSAVGTNAVASPAAPAGTTPDSTTASPAQSPDALASVNSAAEAMKNTKVILPDELTWLTPPTTTPVPLDLKKAMDTALSNNPNVRIAYEQVEESLQNKNLALSPLLPQIHFGPSYTQKDENQSWIDQGINPERKTSLNSLVNIVLFDDQLISNLRSAGFNYLAQKYVYDGVRLQTEQDAALALYTYQQSVDDYNIQVENLRITQVIKNQVMDRNTAGVAGDEDLDRWLSQEAGAKTAVLNAFVVMADALIALNQELGVDPSTDWTIPEPVLNGENYFFLNSDMLDFFHDNRYHISSRFAVFFALAHTPALLAADEGIESRKVQLGAAQRSIFMPDIAASGGYDYIMDETTVTGPRTGRNDTEWNVNVSATFPLYEGGKPVSETKLNEAELQELWGDRQNLVNNIESLADQTLYSMQGTYPGIKYTSIEVEKTTQALDIYINKYAEGTVTLETLISAENSMVQAELDRAQATYVLLKNLARFQLALGWFEAYQTPEEKEKFLHDVEFYRRAQLNDQHAKGPSSTTDAEKSLSNKDVVIQPTQSKPADSSPTAVTEPTTSSSQATPATPATPVPAEPPAATGSH
jgi:outer membrane protein TolC